MIKTLTFRKRFGIIILSLLCLYPFAESASCQTFVEQAIHYPGGRACACHQVEQTAQANQIENRTSLEPLRLVHLMLHRAVDSN